MLKPLLITALLATAASPLAAQSLVGKWDCEGRANDGLAARTLQTYRASGSFYHLVNMSLGNRSQRYDVAIAIEGAWSGEKDILVEQIRTVRVRSVRSNNQDITRTGLGKRVARSIRDKMIRPGSPSRIRLRSLTDQRMTFVDGPFKASCQRR